MPISLPLEGYAPVCPLSQWPVPTVGSGAPTSVKAAPQQFPQEHRRIKHQEPHHSRFLLLLPVDSLMPHRRLAQCFPPCEYPWPDCQCHERAPRQKSIFHYLHRSPLITVPAVSPAGLVYRSRGFSRGSICINKSPGSSSSHSAGSRGSSSAPAPCRIPRSVVPL